MWPNISLRQLQILLAFAEGGGMTAAGRSIGLSHSAVSLQLKALEEGLGRALVDRSTRPPRLTDEGQAVLAQARRIHGLLDEMAAGPADGGARGSLALGIVPSAFVHLAAPALASLRQSAPGIAVRLRAGLSGDLAEAVRSGELDAALVTGPAGAAVPTGLALRLLAEEPLELIASHALLGPAGTTGGAAALGRIIAAHPYIWFSRRTWAGRQIEQVLAARGLAPAEAMEVDALEAIEALVRHGLGVSVVPRPAGIGAAEADPDLLRLRLAGPDARRAIALIEREGHPKLALVDCVAEAFRTILARDETVDHPVLRGDQDRMS
ncbi:MAG: LysR family transcriptional regulator [Pseudomonadota bacterium]